MKHIYILITILIAGLVTGCSSSSGSSPSSSNARTSTLSYTIAPEKAKYAAGESFTITTTVTGEEYQDGELVTSAADTSYSGCSISSFPSNTGRKYTHKAGQGSGCTITITMKPKKTLIRNGVNLISGEKTFKIITE